MIKKLFILTIILSSWAFAQTYGDIGAAQNQWIDTLLIESSTGNLHGGYLVGADNGNGPEVDLYSEKPGTVRNFPHGTFGTGTVALYDVNGNEHGIYSVNNDPSSFDYLLVGASKDDTIAVLGSGYTFTNANWRTGGTTFIDVPFDTVRDNFTILGTFTGGTSTRGSSAFDGNADTVSVGVSNATLSTHYSITLLNNVAPVASDAFTLEKKSWGFILHRNPTANTAAMGFDWIAVH